MLESHKMLPEPFTLVAIETLEFDAAIFILCINCILCLSLAASLYKIYSSIQNIDSAYPRIWPPLISFFISTGIANISALFSLPILYIASKLFVLLSLIWLSISFIRSKEQIELSLSVMREVKKELDETWEWNKGTNE